MKKTIIFLLMAILAVNIASAQKKTNKNKLLKFSSEQSAGWTADYAKAMAKAKQLNLPLSGDTEDQYFGLAQYNDLIPLYYITYNLIAAQSSSTDKLWPSGGMGYSLTGAGQTLGIWDAGAVRATHQEFQTNRVTQGDNPASTHAHATHCAGTMIATGVDNNAHGMSYEADLNAYDWNSDVSEMAAEAAAGLLVSSHSYGFITGWRYNYFGDGRWAWFGDSRVSTEYDFSFGFYDNSAKEYDELAYNAPYYLIVKAAGNDRNEGPAAGTEHWFFDPDNGGNLSLSTLTRQKDGGPNGYDCISHRGVAKNILTVGAVNDVPGGYSVPGDVTMSSFSGWGPTDDGRVKPDIVANGVGLWSPINNSDVAYASYSGTSMATPTASGSLGLIHEFNQELGRSTMLSATVKALVCHTADEAGNTGPDYVYGWGLLNTLSAVELIEENNGYDEDFNIRELTLNNEQEMEFEVYSDGTEPIKVTICWTDPAGTPVPDALNPRTRMLVNNLNVRLQKDGVKYRAWVLYPDNPSSPAGKGTNYVDNIEQVYIDAPEAGTYTIVIDHYNTLDGGSQDFALIMTGVEELIPPTEGIAEGNTEAMSIHPLFQWMEVLRAEGYELQVSTDNTFTTVDFDLTDIPTNTYDFSELDLEFFTQYYWRVRAVNSSGTGPWSDIYSFFTTPDMPNVLSESESQIVCKDETVMLQCVAEGIVLQYQWEKDGIAIDGQTEALMWLADLDFEDNGVYRCKLTNLPGSDVVYSENILINVINETVVTDQPNNAVVGEGRTAVFEVKAHTQGLPPTYQPLFRWYYNNQPIENDETKYAGANSSILTVSNVEDADQTYKYKAEVIGQCGDAVFTDEVQISVPSVNITKQPADQTACIGDAAVFEIAATALNGGTDIKYQWYNDNGILDEGTKYSGVQTEKLTINDLDAQDADYKYWAKCTVVPGMSSYDSDKASLALDTPPEITVQPEALVELNTGDMLDLSIEADGTEPLEYQWHYNGNPVQGATSTTFSIVDVTTDNEGDYHCVVSNECGEAVSRTASVVITFLAVSSVLDNEANTFELAIVPNPAVSETAVSYSLMSDAEVDLSVYDQTGGKAAQLVSSRQTEGRHELMFNAQEYGLSSGIYYLQLSVDGVIITKRIIFVQ